MFPRLLPSLFSAPAPPGLKGFAVLSGLEAGGRGVLISVMPLVMHRAFPDAAVFSRIYFFVGVVSLVAGLMVPWLTRFVPRRWMFSAGTVLNLLAAPLAISGDPAATAVALGLNAVGTVTIFVCLNAYVLDYVARADLGRSQSTQMMYSAASWSVGPALGVWLATLWPAAPFFVAAGFATVLLAVFWVMRLGNGKAIAHARGPAPNPLGYLGRFAAQPRLIAGWLFAVLRSCGWWVYVVYLPIFCIESGLGDTIGGMALSVSNAMLFVTPFILRHVQRASVRRAVQFAFLAASLCFLAATLLAPLPYLTVAAMMLGSVFLVTLDVCGGLPFLMAVKPSERTEMSAVYSSFRDVSGILTPGVAYLVLLVAPLPAIFGAAAAGLLTGWGIAQRLHPRLGVRRAQRAATPAG